MMTAIRSLLLVPLLLLGARQGAAGSVVVGVEETLPVQSDKGFALLTRFAKEKDQELRYRSLPINRLFKELRSGEVSVKYPDNPQWKKRDRGGAKVYFSQKPLSTVKAGFIQRKGSPSPIRKVGAILGYTLPDLGGRYEIVYVRTFSSLRNLLKSLRVDAVYGNLEMFLSGQNDPSFKVEYSPKSPVFLEEYYVSSLTSEGFLSALNNWMHNSL